MRVPEADLRAARRRARAIVSGPIRPVFSASGTNTSGPDEPALRVVPAHERLDAGDEPGADGRLRLVVDDELALLERAAQLAGERQARGAVALLRAVVGLDAGRGRPWRRTSRCRRGAASCRRRAPWSGATATPTLASVRITTPSTSIGSAMLRRSDWARLIASTGSATGASRTRELVAAEARDGVARAHRPPRAASRSRAAAGRRAGGRACR